ncbi:MAG: hypothetical protein IPN84_07985 [Sphingomonadales bacterium]|nr:hypothetical protein [Sphingomonadales bacterium]
MKRIWLVWLGLTCAGAMPVAAQHASCPAGEVLDPSADIDAWTLKHRTVVQADFKTEIVNEYCMESSKILSADLSRQDSLRTSDSDINRVRSAVIDEYLDSYANPDRVFRTLGATLRSHLGASGFSRPVPRARGLIHVEYRHVVARVQLRGKDYPPWSRFILLPGRTLFVGLDGARRICRGLIMVRVSAPVKVVC